ncbi:MAG TPA: NAD(P)/FAD-dependent oxidoreductase [Rhodanobacteraceae bacterium]|nr:NAD(P)/FAD-dependent oxidoreductase [Rhodanobacteraceae bacterium]
MRIAIVGYGTAGQAAAIFLARDGHDVEVFERSPELKPVGAGFLLQPTGLGVMSQLGLREAAIARGARIERLHGENANGRMVMDMRYADHAEKSFGLGMTRGALFALLHAACAHLARIHTGVCIERTREDGLVDDAGGERGPFDLIVAADGANSTLRASAALARRDPLYPWGAMWCLLPAEGWPHTAELRQRYDGTRRMLGVLPVGTRPDRPGRWLTFYYSLAGARIDKFGADDLVTLQADVAALWPELAERTRAIVDPVQLNRARYRDVVLKQVSHDRVVFIGDAAHGMSPQLGQGVNMALLDAEALADALRAHTDVARALAQYARTRASHVAVYRRLSRSLTPLFQSDSAWLGALRDKAFGPLGRLPLARTEMLKILTGTKRSWWA